MGLTKIRGALGQFPSKRLAVVGDIILDMYSWGSITRLNPEEEGSPLVNIDNDSYVLGGAANVAQNIASLGGNVSLYGLVNNDSAGRTVKSLCEGKGIALQTFSDERPTTLKQRIMSRNRQIARLDREVKDDIDRSLADQIYRVLSAEISSLDGIVLSDYNKGIFIEELGQQIIGLANKHGVPTYVDTKPRLVESFKGAYLITPNRSEAEKIVGYSIDASDMGQVQHACRDIVDRLDTNIGLITLSEHGIAYHDASFNHVPTYARAVNDVTGAGDTVIAALSLGLSSGLEVETAVEFANIAAGVAVSHVGTYSVSTADVVAYMQRNDFVDLYNGAK